MGNNKHEKGIHPLSISVIEALTNNNFMSEYDFDYECNDCAELFNSNESILSCPDCKSLNIKKRR